MFDIAPPFDQIFTTHVGSLPRPQRLLDLLDPGAGRRVTNAEYLASELTKTVNETVSRQVAIGISIVSDGEMSKPSYATYVTERLTGFSGEFRGHAARDLLDYRDFARHQVKIGAVVPDAGGACCRGPVELRGLGGLYEDLARMRAAVDASAPLGAFVNSASPGVIAVFQKNEFYPDDDSYIEAVAMAMRHEYEAIVDAGFVLQIDSPDPVSYTHLRAHETAMNISYAVY